MKKNVLPAVTAAIILAGAIGTAVSPIGEKNFTLQKIIHANAEVYDDYIYDRIGNGEIEITRFNADYYGEVEIPDTINGLTVTSIGTRAFASCAGITKVTIPETVTYIGDEAFKDCSAIEQITIPDGVEFIGNSAFEKCSSLSSVALPESLNEIGKSTFSKSGLISVEIPESIEKIGSYAFWCCADLKEVTIPKNVTNMERAFYGAGIKSVNILSSNINMRFTFASCHNLETVTFSDELTEISDNAFHLCNNLKTVKMPKKLKKIDSRAFYMTGLENVELNQELTTIGDEAFFGCTELLSLRIPKKVTTIGVNAIGGYDENCDSLPVGSAPFQKVSGFTLLPLSIKN